MSFNILEFFISKIIIGTVTLYKLFISPVLNNRCRFYPTCSTYCIDAIYKYGLYGIILTIKRLFKCHPYGTSGYDPII
jgi:putative membrane protein insertion efficiency factor